MKRVLLIAFHYPPLHVSSGIQRTLKFSQYLPDYGWKPLVLSAHPRAYPVVGSDQVKEIRSDIVVRYAFALNTARHLSIAGKYPGWLALPDRWVSWWLGGVWTGLQLIGRYRPSILWSTYPIATAHWIGWTLQRLTGLPWVADFRDSMTEPGYPPDPAQRNAYLRIERATMARCARAVFTTPGALRMYAERYTSLPAERFALIPNGYDEGNFVDAEKELKAGGSQDGPLLLVHSGVLYPSERDPRPFFAALASLRAAGYIEGGLLKVRLRATGHDELYRPMLKEYGITDIVELAPGVSYRQALQEMLLADGLLLFQSSGCNHQIPAKLYEYLRAKRPIFALTDPAGDTAQVLYEAGIDTVVALDQEGAIREGLQRFLVEVRANRAPLPQEEHVRTHSRRARTQQLAELLSKV